MSLFSHNFLSDENIIHGIIGDGVLQRNTENRLYEQFFYFIKDATFKHKLSEDEAASLYTDTILAFIENVKNKRFEGKSAVKTYLYQIFSNKCVEAACYIIFTGLITKERIISTSCIRITGLITKKRIISTSCI